MKNDTWLELEKQFVEFPISKAESVPIDEIYNASSLLSMPFPQDYIDFVGRYGGAIVGPYPIIGLRQASPMGNRESSVIVATNYFRDDNWPGTENWVIFSVDHCGNPYGFDKDGVVWLSDHDAGEIVKIADSFEDFLRKVCLKIE